MITANKILGLLAERHHKDVFVPECKDGPTWSGSHLRLDAWAMPRSWSKLRYIGYEIKISRSDFLKDQKYVEYLNLCNELYFVCPQGIIKEDELTDGIGLLIVSKNGTNLYTKKKAKFREIEIPVGLLHYIIMCRARITKNMYDGYPENDLDHWRTIYEQKKESYIIGHAVAKRIRSEIAEKIAKVESENERIIKKMENYDSLRDLLSGMGITDEHSLYAAQRKVDELKCDIKSILGQYEIQRVIDGLSIILEKMSGVNYERP